MYSRGTLTVYNDKNNSFKTIYIDQIKVTNSLKNDTLSILNKCYLTKFKLFSLFARGSLSHITEENSFNKKSDIKTTVTYNIDELIELVSELGFSENYVFFNEEWFYNPFEVKNILENKEKRTCYSKYDIDRWLNEFCPFLLYLEKGEWNKLKNELIFLEAENPALYKSMIKELNRLTEIVAKIFWNDEYTINRVSNILDFFINIQEEVKKQKSSGIYLDDNSILGYNKSDFIMFFNKFRSMPEYKNDSFLLKWTNDRIEAQNKNAAESELNKYIEKYLLELSNAILIK